MRRPAGHGGVRPAGVMMMGALSVARGEHNKCDRSRRPRTAVGVIVGWWDVEEVAAVGAQRSSTRKENLVLAAARKYLARHLAVIPVPAGTKVPVLKEWEKLKLSDSDLPKHFDKACNIGVLNGAP